MIHLYVSVMVQKSTMNQIKHTINTLYVLLDIFLMATPFRLFHVFITIFVGSSYVLFNGLFFLCGISLSDDPTSTESALSSLFTSASPTTPMHTTTTTTATTTTAASKLLSAVGASLSGVLSSTLSPLTNQAANKDSLGFESQNFDSNLNNVNNEVRKFLDQSGAEWGTEEEGFRVRGWHGGAEHLGQLGMGGGGRIGWSADGTNAGSNDIYNYLNWHTPVEAIITCVLAMFLCVLAQVLLFLLFRLRLYLTQRFLLDGGSSRDAELQNIVSMSRSSSYNSTIDGYDGSEENGYFNVTATKLNGVAKSKPYP